MFRKRSRTAALAAAADSEHDSPLFLSAGAAGAEEKEAVTL